MGRPRGGKAKKPTPPQATKVGEDADADAGSGDDEAVVPAYKRRGRPQTKHFKADDDTDEEDVGNGEVKVEAMEDSDGTRPSVPSSNGVADSSFESGSKKRRRRQWKRGSASSGMEDEEEEEEDEQEPVRQAGFRHHGSRRKSTPRRAAEAGVECK